MLTEILDLYKAAMCAAWALGTCAEINIANKRHQPAVQIKSYCACAIYSDLNNFKGKWTPLDTYISTETCRSNIDVSKNNLYISIAENKCENKLFTYNSGSGLRCHLGPLGIQENISCMKDNFAMNGTVQWEDWKPVKGWQQIGRTKSQQTHGQDNCFTVWGLSKATYTANNISTVCVRNVQ
jgi:hypothetical protein